MYYDEYRGKNRKRYRREKRRGGCLAWLIKRLIRLVCIVLALAILACVILYFVPYSFLNTQPSGTELSLTDGLSGDRINILFLGLDALDDDMQRSDTMIIASFGKDDIRLVSLMRDTMVDIPGYGRGKLNSAYSHGGPELAMRVVNETFGMNITNYIAVDMQTMVDLVDAVGGVEMDVSEKEVDELVKYAKNTLYRIYTENPEKYADYGEKHPDIYEAKTAGVQTLNGVFATSYVRIRKIDSDFSRTYRQRQVLTAIMNKIKDSCMKPSLYIKLLDIYQNSLKTNISLPKLLSIGLKSLASKEILTYRLPENGNLADNYSYLEIIDSEQNIQSLYEFLYN